MQYLADANYRQTVNLRMPGQSPPYYPGRLTDRSVPNVDEILGRGASMPDRYGDVRRAINCPPPPMPPAAPQSVGWLWSPRRNALPLDPHFDARRNELPADPQHEDFSKHDGNYTYAFNSMLPGGRAAYGSPLATHRSGSPLATRRSGSPIATHRNGSPIHTRRSEPPTDLANFMNIFSENLPDGRANESPTDPRLNVSYTGSPVGPGRSVSPIDTQRDYANTFSQNLPGGPAMFNDMCALPVVRNMDSINPSDPHFHTQTSLQDRHPTHFNAERWSNYDDGSSENYNGNRSFQDFEANRSFQGFEANRSSLNVDGNRSFQNLDFSRIIHNLDGSRSFQNFSDSFQSGDGNRSSFYFNAYRGGNDSGFVNDRPSYGSELRNFGNFGGSNDPDYSLIDRGYNRQGINAPLLLNTSYPPAKERKRKAKQLDDCLTEKRARPERIEKVFRIGGFRLEYASHNTMLELPQPEKRSHAVRFFKKYPAYRIGSKKSNAPAAVEVECNLIECDDMVDAIIRHTIAEEWKKVYREKNYRSWGCWWNDYKDCGADIRKELDQFDSYNMQKSFRPLEGPIDSEEYVRLAIAALKENNITYLKNMQDIYRLVDFTVLENLTADASGHLQDIIRSIPNHLWRYKMRSMIFTWTWYQKLASCENPIDETRQNIMPLWNNPILHWLAKQAYDELILLSKVECSPSPPKQSSDPAQEES